MCPVNSRTRVGGSTARATAGLPPISSATAASDDGREVAAHSELPKHGELLVHGAQQRERLVVERVPVTLRRGLGTR